MFLLCRPQLLMSSLNYCWLSPWEPAVLQQESAVLTPARNATGVQSVTPPVGGRPSLGINACNRISLGVLLLAWGGWRGGEFAQQTYTTVDPGNIAPLVSTVQPQGSQWAPGGGDAVHRGLYRSKAR